MSLGPEITAPPMITRSPPPQGPAAWQAELRDAIRDPAELLASLGLQASDLDVSATAVGTFPFRVTRAYAARMRFGDATDPLLLQVLPIGAESLAAPGFSDDPVGEFDLSPGTNLLQKYAGRALLIMTAACAINCRYCFRRAFPYSDNMGRAPLAASLDAIARDSSIVEVILSGGDPLVLNDDVLADVMHALAGIAHVRRLRIHSRLPIALPARMTPALITLLSRQRYPVVLVIHANHPHEIDDVTAVTLQRCRDAGITVLNQAVLLRGINDSADTLASLSETLFAAGVLPYYVHLLDRVSGTAHFEVNTEQTLAIERELRARLPGYLMPRFVREVAGATSKQALLPSAPGATST
jgi:EF-P beta-lysylation protein EpmB